MKLIVTADWHLRYDLPRCRIDNNWIEFQQKIIQQIYDIAENKNANVGIVGDLFHRSQEPSIMQNIFLTSISEKVKTYIEPGNHDLLYHKTENLDKSLIGNIMEMTRFSNIIRPLTDIANVKKFDEEKVRYKKSNIGATHQLTFPSNVKKIKQAKDKIKHPKDIIQQFPQEIEYILLGDYHSCFIEKIENKLVINPGCTTIQNVDLLNYQPVVVFLDTEKNVYEKINLITGKENLISDSYVKEENERDKRVDAFVEKINSSSQFSLDFEKNVYENINNINNTKVETIVKEIMEQK